MLDRLIAWLEENRGYHSAGRQGAPLFDRFYLLRTPWISIVLHRWLRSDPDDVHDHPWANWSLVLRGILIEHFHDGTCHFLTEGSHELRPSPLILHRVEVPKQQRVPITLFVYFKRRRSWGFLHGSGNWEEHESNSYKKFRGIILPRLIRD